MIKEYFSLGFQTDNPVFGKKETKEVLEQKKMERKNFWLTIGMYVAVWLGVIGQKLMSIYQEGKPITWDGIGIGGLLLSLVIATVIFPQVFPRAFAKMPRVDRNVEGGNWRFVQFCIAFQQGFFWQSLITLLTPKA